VAIKTPKLDVASKSPLKVAEQKMAKKGPIGPPPLPVKAGKLIKAKK
jgi:hypothetical protein